MISILVVEDEEYARKSLVKKIKEYDTQNQLQVFEAVNGEQGYELYCLKNPYLVMTDIKMPNLSGLDLLKKIKEKNRNSLVIMLSAYSDFEYAREALQNGAMDYILKPIEDEKLKACLDKFLNKTKEEKREQLVTGRDMVTRFIFQEIKKSEVKDLIGRTMFQKVFPKYQVLAIYFPQRSGLSKEDMLLRIGDALGEEMWTGFRIVEANEKIWTLVVNIEINVNYVVRKILKIFSEHSYYAFIGQSAVYSDTAKISEAYQEAINFLKYKVFTKNQIISQSDLPEKQLKEYYLSNEKEEFLKQALLSKNETKTKYIIGQIMADVRKNDWISIECLELLYSQITVILRRYLASYMDPQENSAISKREIIDFNSLEELEEYFTNIGCNICKLVSQDEKAKDIVEVMMEYATTHFNQDITVKEMAENILFMNSAYVSHVFAEKQGISFSSWLKNLRMEKARELLESSQLSVTEIAFMSGYNDTSQFIRVFKAENGMTPNKYRNQEHGKR